MLQIAHAYTSLRVQVCYMQDFLFGSRVNSAARIQHHVHLGNAKPEPAMELFPRAIVRRILPHLGWQFGKSVQFRGLLTFCLSFVGDARLLNL